MTFAPRLRYPQPHTLEGRHIILELECLRGFCTTTVVAILAIVGAVAFLELGPGPSPRQGTEQSMVVRHNPPTRGVMKTDALLVRIRDDAEEVRARGETPALKELLAGILGEMKDEAFPATEVDTAEDRPTPPVLRVVSERGDP